MRPGSAVSFRLVRGWIRHLTMVAAVRAELDALRPRCQPGILFGWQLAGAGRR
jgi:hypothetical protein